MRKWLPRAAEWTRQFLEWLLVLVFVYSSAALFGQEPFGGNSNFIVAMLGSHVALWIYMLWFAFLGIGLALSKIKRWNHWHTKFLMMIYLTTIYTSLLTLQVDGFIAIIDDIIIGLVAAGLWLWWKFKTEYTTYEKLEHLDEED